MFESSLEISLHNWRRFASAKFSLPLDSSILLTDQNGAGKTSLLAAVYSLLTGRSWPGTRFREHLRAGEQYFGLSTQFADWFASGRLVGNNRLSFKLEKGDFFPLNKDFSFPRVLTYLPNENSWLSHGRSGKLAILDEILLPIFAEYGANLDNLHKAVKSKQRILLLAQEEESQRQIDWNLVLVLNEQILAYSREIWNFRYTWWQLFQEQFSHFSALLENEIKDKDFHLDWQASNFQGNRIKFSPDHFSASSSSPEIWQRLWQKELLLGKVLFGAQRDDFGLFLNQIPAQNYLSRGEMRLLILFSKQLSLQILKQNEPQVPIYWLLDDVFNELDPEREQKFFAQYLSQVDWFLASSTKFLDLPAQAFSLENLKSG